MERLEASQQRLDVLGEMVDEASKEVANARKLLNEALHYFNFANRQYVEELNLMRKISQD